MYSIRQIAITLAAFMVIISCSADAALKYQQDLTFISWKSQEDIEERVQEFCSAAEGDADIKVIDVKYKQKKQNRKNISYSAIITCQVSQVDKDFMRINGKIFQQKYGLIDTVDFSMATH